MIQTEEQVRANKINTFKMLLNNLGGSHKFKKPLKYRETPHSPTMLIFEVSLNDDIDNIYDALDTIIQQLKYDIHNDRNQRINI